MSEPSEWIALRVDVPAEAADAVANFLAEAGAPGVLTEDSVEARAWTRVEAPFPANEHARVSAALARYLASLRQLDPGFDPVVLAPVPVPAIDWAALARRHHRPLAVGRRILVAPPWDVPVAAEREVLVIEPGMAFGTGQHATTRGCLEAIEAALAAHEVGAALDVGTGSGLLAIALARLGVPHVVAIDTDPLVVPIARANCAANRVAGVVTFAGGVAAVRGRFDLVVANLLAEPLVREASAFAARVAPAGRLVLSGLLTSQVPEVLAAYRGWRLGAERGEEEWATLTLVRTS